MSHNGNGNLAGFRHDYIGEIDELARPVAVDDRCVTEGPPDDDWQPSPLLMAPLNTTLPPPEFPQIVSARALLAEAPAQPQAVVHSLLRRREVANLIAAPKSHKSFLALLIALCVATGRMLFGTFPVVRGRVLILDYELHRGTIFERLKAVAAAAGILAEEYADTLDIITLRESHLDINGLVKFTHKELIGHDYRLVIVDAFYNVLPADADENSNAQIARFYTTFKQLATATDAGWLLIHHMSKGYQGGKQVSDLGAGAGSQSRSADAHMALRQHELPDSMVLDGILRSWAPISPIGLDWEYPLWRHNPELDVTALARPSSGGRPPKAKEPAPEKLVAVPYTPETFAAEFIGAEPKNQHLIAAEARAKSVPFREIQGLILRAAYAKLAYLWKFPSDKGLYYANREQTLLDADVSHTHTNPPHPPDGQQVPSGAGSGARVKKEKKKKGGKKQ